MLKLWGRASSINVQKVLWTIAELGLPHERIDAGGTVGKLDTSEFGTMNPNRRVPVLDDNGFVLWESNAIVRYLADTYGRGSLAPEGRHSFARADQWTDWAITTLYADIRTCYQGFTRVPAAQRDMAAISAAADRLGRSLAILDGVLAGRSFILGDRLTFADIVAGVYMYRYYNLDIVRPRNAFVTAWYQRLTARPGYQQHVMLDFSAMPASGSGGRSGQEATAGVRPRPDMVGRSRWVALTPCRAARDPTYRRRSECSPSGDASRRSTCRRCCGRRLSSAWRSTIRRSAGHTARPTRPSTAK
jgi:glutathione S-transferase